ncbi:MAG: DUF493 domain-containing protein [Gammaproteobacteria bacterium]|nr:MAG: DUF493 domain-containing protein [Gammaproteobacteria bacterium]
MTLQTFPCEFTIKVFGLASDEFKATVSEIIRKHVASFSHDAIQSRPSEGGKYSALSITVHVESKEQLDRIYEELSANKQVIMAL